MYMKIKTLQHRSRCTFYHSSMGLGCRFWCSNHLIHQHTQHISIQVLNTKKMAFSLDIQCAKYNECQTYDDYTEIQPPLTMIIMNTETKDSSLLRDPNCGPSSPSKIDPLPPLPLVAFISCVKD